MTKTHVFIFLIVIILISYFIAKTSWNMGLQYAGYCVELGRPLTDQEKIEIVIKDINKPVTGYILFGGAKDEPHNESRSYIQKNLVPYKSVEEFLKANPNCCSVKVQETYSGNTGFPDANDKTDLDRAFGGYAGHITVNYMARYIDHDDGKIHTVKDELVYTIQNCGILN